MLVKLYCINASFLADFLQSQQYSKATVEIWVKICTCSEVVKSQLMTAVMLTLTMTTIIISIVAFISWPSYLISQLSSPRHYLSSLLLFKAWLFYIDFTACKDLSPPKPAIKNT